MNDYEAALRNRLRHLRASRHWIDLQIAKNLGELEDASFEAALDSATRNLPPASESLLFPSFPPSSTSLDHVSATSDDVVLTDVTWTPRSDSALTDQSVRDDSGDGRGYVSNDRALTEPRLCADCAAAVR